MLGYRMFFINDQGHIRGREEFFVEDDKRAIERALQLFSPHSDHDSGFELWQEKRRVHSQRSV